MMRQPGGSDEVTGRAPDPATVKGRWALLRRDLDLVAFAEVCALAHDRAPEDPETAAQYAEALGLTGRPDDKMAVLERALARGPDTVSLNISYGIELMMGGDYHEAWPYFAHRVRKANSMRNNQALSPERRWRGEALEGKRIMVMGEQGLGDAVQFARYAIDLARAGARPLLDVHPPVRPLMQGSPALGAVLAPDTPTEIHHWLPMLDLVPVFAPTREAIRWHGAYISPPALTRPLAVLGRSDRLRVGLAWQGNANNATDFARSMPLEALAPLADVGTCRFYSLMPGSQNGTAVPKQMTWITDLSAETVPFANLARTIASLDVVVTVCTAIAHLSGAMGKPTFLMLSAMPDWRWGRMGETTPWYPSMRLFRQDRLGDWPPVVRAVATELSRL